MNEWISVKDILPEDGQIVIATDGKYIFAGIGGKGRVWAYGYDIILNYPPLEFGRVKYWMPVPEIPKI